MMPTISLLISCLLLPLLLQTHSPTTTANAALLSTPSGYVEPVGITAPEFIIASDAMNMTHSHQDIKVGEELNRILSEMGSKWNSVQENYEKICFNGIPEKCFKQCVFKYPQVGEYCYRFDNVNWYDLEVHSPGSGCDDWEEIQYPQSREELDLIVALMRMHNLPEITLGVRKDDTEAEWLDWYPGIPAELTLFEALHPEDRFLSIVPGGIKSRAVSGSHRMICRQVGG